MSRYTRNRLEGQTVAKLRLLCRKEGLYGYSKLRKGELVDYLLAPKVENLSLSRLQKKCKEANLPAQGPRHKLISLLAPTYSRTALPEELIAHIASFLVGTSAFSTFAVLSQTVLWWMEVPVKQHQVLLAISKVSLKGQTATARMFEYVDQKLATLDVWRAYIAADYTRVHLAPREFLTDEQIAVSVLSQKTSGGYYEMFPEPKSYNVRLAAVSHNANKLIKVPQEHRTDELLLAACKQKQGIIGQYLDLYSERIRNPDFLESLLVIRPSVLDIYPQLLKRKEKQVEYPESLYAQTLSEKGASKATHSQLLAAICQDHRTLRSHAEVYKEALRDKAFLSLIQKCVPELDKLYPELLVQNK